MVYSKWFNARLPLCSCLRTAHNHVNYAIMRSGKIMVTPVILRILKSDFRKIYTNLFLY